jgi:outer membrane protein assembly factor BamB
MKESPSKFIVVLPFAVSVAAAFLVLWHWFSYDPGRAVVASVPGMDGRPVGKDGAPIEDAVNIAGTFVRFETAAATELPGCWPNFRGPDRDNIDKEDVKLADAWPAGGPKVLWSIDLGEGHAAPAIYAGRVYLLDYDEAKRRDALRCFALADGKELWRRSYAVPAKRNHGLSRTIPAVDARSVVTLGPRCHVLCVDRESGNFRWGIDLQRDYGTTEPLWFAGQCPLIEDGIAILAPAGPKTLLMGVDCATGKVVWQTPNPAGWKMSHSSVMPMTLCGRKMYVYAAVGGMAGVSAEAEDRGKLLWQVPWSANVVAPSPVGIAGDRVFITAGYGAGCLMVQVARQDQGFAAKPLFQREPKDWLASEQQTPIYHNGLLYGIMPKDAEALKRQFVGYAPDDKTPRWSSEKTTRFGLGPFLLADNKFFILNDDGMLTMIKANGNEYVQLGQAKMLSGSDAWGPLAMAGTRMLLRDSKRLICIELGKP